MAYVEYSDYTGYSTVEVPQEDFPKYEGIASAIIDTLTHSRIVLWGGLSALPIFVQTAVKKAVCAQIQSMAYNYGDAVAATEDVSELEYQSETLGKYSYNRGALAGKDLETVNGIAVSPMVRPYLFPTGLLFSGIDPSYSPYGLDI